MTSRAHPSTPPPMRSLLAASEPPARGSDVALIAHSLGERVKELCCLYAVSDICGCRTLTLDEAIQRIVDVMPPAWQYPETCSVRATIDGREYRSARFVRSEYVQQQAIEVDARVIGLLEVFYAEERPPAAEGPFLQEERNLIVDLALRIGKLIESRSVRRGLEEVAARHEALLGVTRDLVIELDAEGRVIEYHAGDFADWSPVLERLKGSLLRDLRGRYVSQRIVDEILVRVRRVISAGIPEDFEQQVGTNGSAREFEVRLVRASAATALASIRETTARRVAQHTLAEATLHTQTRVAKNLENCLCKRLSAIEELAKSLTQELPDLLAHAEKLAQEVEDTLSTSRSLAGCLSSRRLETDGLVAMLSELTEHTARTTELACELRHSGPAPLNYAINRQLFRIAQAAIDDAVQRAGAERIVISLESSSGWTTLRVEDDGRATQQRARDTSVSVMKAQAELIGGIVEQVNGTKRGTALVCRVPTQAD